VANEADTTLDALSDQLCLVALRELNAKATVWTYGEGALAGPGQYNKLSVMTALYCRRSARPWALLPQTVMMCYDRSRLARMLDAARKAVAFTTGQTRADLDQELQLALALTRLVEIVGEAANHVAPDTRERLPQVP
jgi:hypothetical protein